MKLTTSELVYINEAAKALKQKDFILIDNAMIGLDNIQNIVTYVLLDTNFITNYNNGIIINQRALLAFIKTLSTESDFTFDSINNVIKTISGGELTIGFNLSIAELACDQFKYASYIDTNMHVAIEESEAPDIMNQIQSMNSTHGAVGINYYGYYMTLFPSFLPINKNDKMYIKIMKRTISLGKPRSFITKFRIKKKKFDVITYVNFIKV